MPCPAARAPRIPRPRSPPRRLRAGSCPPARPPEAPSRPQASDRAGQVDESRSPGPETARGVRAGGRPDPEEDRMGAPDELPVREGYAAWAPCYDDDGNPLTALEGPAIRGWFGPI